MEKAHKGSGRSHFSRKILAIIGLVGGITAATLGVWEVAGKVMENREIQKKVNIHLYSGDRFAGQGEYPQAISEYEEAIELDNGNVEAHRRIISAQKERLQQKAFGQGYALDMALRDDYEDFAFVSDEEINSVLQQIYELQALHPPLKDDIGLLLDEALVLKTSGRRVEDEIEVLNKADSLHPGNPEVLAELGLAYVVVSGDPAQRTRGIDLVRRAVAIMPDEARYHLYLARILELTCKPHNDDRGDAGKCAEAIREYHRASDLATDGDIWSRRIRTRAAMSSMEMFHFYANRQGDILTWNLDMPLEERITEIEYLMPKKVSSSRRGVHDYPEFWLATLYTASGDAEKAERAVRTLVDEKGDYAVTWFWSYVAFLEEKGHDPGSLAELRAIGSKIEGAGE